MREFVAVDADPEGLRLCIRALRRLEAMLGLLLVALLWPA